MNRDHLTCPPISLAPLAVRIRVPAGPDAPAAARRALATLGDRLGPASLGPLELVVSELVTNSVRHAGLPAGAALEVEVGVRDDAITVIVYDGGRGFDPAERPDETSVGGWGLHVVERLARRWCVEREGGARVVCELAR